MASDANPRPTLIDSNILLDLLTRDSRWAEWSARHLKQVIDDGPALINQIVYGEVSLGFDAPEALDDLLATVPFTRANLPWSAAFVAARAFATYRSRGGTRTSTLPDFLIGAHAAVLGARLLTRDAARYRTYYPRVELIAP